MTHTRSRGARRAAASVLAAALAGSMLAGCTSLSGTEGKNYVSGDGTVTEIAVADRGKPVELSGTTLAGDELDVADFRGGVTVINVWGSWCPGCRAEAKDLVAVAKSYADKDVHFVGIDVRETSPGNGRAYERTFGLPYPSLDDQGGASLLALRGDVPPNSIPSTLLLDAKGRVAARILGEIPSQTTLKDLIESAGGSGD